MAARKPKPPSGSSSGTQEVQDTSAIHAAAAAAPAPDRQTILYVITQSGPGGAQRYVLDLATHLPARFEAVICAGADGGGGLLEDARRTGLRVAPLTSLRRSISPLADQRAVQELRQLFASEQPAVIHLNSSKAGVLGSMAGGRRYRTVYTVHGWVFRERLSWWKRLAYVQAEKQSARYLDRIIVLSESDRSAGLKLGVAPEKLRIIRNGIQAPQFQPRQDARARLSELTGASLDSRPLILCVASFYPTKGLGYLIDAMAQVKPPALCVVVGDGELRPQLEQRIAELGLAGRVLLPGHVPAAAELLRAADVFVLPSVKEGLPYVLLEAMAARVPVVATRVGGVPEVISGLLVEPGAAQELAAAINAQLARPFIAPELPPTFEQMLEQTVQCYEELIGQPARQRG